jgi:hypothetical protein
VDTVDRDKKLINQLKDVSFSIKNAAAHINIVSINASIETAHAASGIRKLMDDVLNVMMTTNSRLLAKLLDSRTFSLDTANLEQFATWIGVDDIFITDADGVTVGSNQAAAIGWQFPDDPTAQAYAFRALIGKSDGVVTQPIQARDLDSVMYKFVGVSRIDDPGIVQIGIRADTITKYQTEISSVFGVLSQEIKNLEIQMKEASKKVNELVDVIQKTDNS